MKIYVKHYKKKNIKHKEDTEAKIFRPTADQQYV